MHLIMIIIYFGDSGDIVEETEIVCVDVSQPVVAPYVKRVRH